MDGSLGGVEYRTPTVLIIIQHNLFTEGTKSEISPGNQNENPQYNKLAKLRRCVSQVKLWVAKVWAE